MDRRMGQVDVHLPAEVVDTGGIRGSMQWIEDVAVSML